MRDTVIKPVSGLQNQQSIFRPTRTDSNINSINQTVPRENIGGFNGNTSTASSSNYSHGLYAFFAKADTSNDARSFSNEASSNNQNGTSRSSTENNIWAEYGAKSAAARDNSGLNFGPGRGSTGNIFDPNGIGGGGGGSFQGIPNDGNSDPLYDASKHSAAENEKISNMMTIMNSSSSSETSKANAVDGEKFTKAFTESILSGRSLQDTISSLDGKNLRGQTSQAYNTENMSKEAISTKNKAHGTAIILRGSDAGVSSMMARDEANVRKAYEALGLDVKVVHSEKEFEQALMSAREQAITDKANGQESILATHVISHGYKAGGEAGFNSENAHGALAMQGGGSYHEKDIIGDIAGALESTENGEDPFKHSYNSFTACHSGAIDNEQALAANNGQSGNSESSYEKELEKSRT